MSEYKIMPEEPTGEMVDASQCECGSGADHVDYVRSDYKAMREAAPTITVPEWQPISTLEHGHIDDSKVILPGGRPCPAAFESDYVLLMTEGHGRPWVGQSMAVGGVLIGWGGPAPTHWMPLPEPPKKEISDDRCRTCSGTGSVEAIVETDTGSSRCPYISEPCPDCKGDGR